MDPNTRRAASTVADALDGDEAVVSFRFGLLLSRGKIDASW